MPHAHSLFADKTGDWPGSPPRGCDDAPDRMRWLRQCWRGYAQAIAIRTHYGLEPPDAFDREIVGPAVCYCQRQGWPVALAVTAMDAERRHADAEGDRHERLLRMRVLPLVRAERPSKVIIDALTAVNRQFDCPLTIDELIDIGQGFRPRRRR